MLALLCTLGLGLLDLHAEPPERAPAEARRTEALAQLERAGVADVKVTVDQNGDCILDLSNSEIADLSPLRGLPVDFMSLRHATNVRDLAPLKGMRLTGLNLAETSVTDLSPLAAMPLKNLDLRSTKVKDLSPLKGMPLFILAASDTPVEDLSPLRGLPLVTLFLSRTGVTDLRPLTGMPLHALHIDATSVTDLRPLAGMPLQALLFQPERIEAGIDILRGMKSLEVLGGGKVSSGFVGAPEFWERYDHGDPVDRWLTAVAAGEETYAPEPELGQFDAAREAHLQELLVKLGDERYADREAAQKALKAQSRDIVPWLLKHATMDDPEIRFRVREIVAHLQTAPEKTPSFAFAFQRQVPLSQEQWRQAMEPWLAKSKTGEAHLPTDSGTGEIGPFAQSFTSNADKISAVELMIYAAHGGRGWLKIDLCQDDGGKPAANALARTWIRIDTRDQPPHNVYLPVDLPDTQLAPGKTYWLTYGEIPDADSPTKGMTQTGASRRARYPNGKLLLPEGHVVPAWSASFRVISDCPPVPLLRKLTAEEAAALPDPSAVQVIWQSTGE